ncbi:hemagglutinin [Acinetobacter stercoris]|uniref:Hemagglutinin n=1 Tax=Acinetobacter stercoris TaxID=2126983 RepID=A0A2U3N3L8_9GAMM|nr:hemagglutinin [Acinetobacter stercoris]
MTTPLTFTGDSGSSVNKLGSTLSVLGDGNITTTASQGQIAVSLNKTLTGLTSISTGNTFIDSNGLSITGGPSITTAGIDAANSKISNVAAGTANTDAVNVSQLTAASAASDARTDALGTSTASNLGGGASYDVTTGEISAPNYSVTTNPNEAGATMTVHNVGDAINSLTTAVTTPLTFTGDSGSSINKLGSTLSVLGDGNITTTASQGQIAVSLNKTLTDLTSISTGNTFIDSNGLSITGGPSITTAGIDAAGKKISNVADGTAASDAINKGQLDTALTAQDSKSDGLGSSTAAALGGGASYDATTGGISAPNYSVTTNPNEAGATTTVHNVGDAINSLTTAVTTPLTFTGDSGSSVNKLGSTLSVLGDGNITTTASQGQIAVSLNKTLTGLTSISTGNTFIDSNGLSITGGPSITTAGIDAAGKKISNVAAGTANTDAVNVSQLTAASAASDARTDALGTSTASNLGGGASYDATTGEISAPNYSVTTNPNEAGATTTVHNVGDAINSLTTAVTTPLTFTGDSGSSVNPLGSSLAMLGDSNITTAMTQGQLAIKLNKDLKDLSSIETTDGKGNSNLMSSVGNTVTDNQNTTIYGANGIDINNGTVTLSNNGLSITNGPSITVSGINAGNKVISNVAAGVAATDAVNKAQLDSIVKGQDAKTDILGNATASALGGGASYDPTTGSISAPGYQVTINPADTSTTTTVNNVADAINSLNTAVMKPLTFIGDNGTSINQLGSTLAFIGDNNIITEVMQGQVQVKLNKDLKGMSSVQIIDENDPAKIATLTANGTEVTDGKNTAIYGSNGVNINNGAVTLSNNGLIIANGPGITVSGINAGNKVISNVANGVAATDAVNVGQLDSAVNSLNQAIKDLNSNAVQYDDITDNTANTHSVTLAGNNGTTIHNLADGEVVSGSKDAVNGGQLADVRDNLQNQITQNTYDINNIKNDINNGTVGLVQQAGGKDAEITVAKDTGGTKVNVGGTSGDRIVTGVANGAVTDKSKDAVNGSQLNTTNQAIIEYLGGGAVYDTNTQSFTAPSYSVGDSVHHNVGDAINALNQEDQNLNSKIDNLGNQLQEVFQSTNKRINDVEKRANAGIAAALSLEAAPFVPGKYTYAAGTAYHGGESAVGITLRKTADNGRWSITSGIAAASQGEPSFRIGVSGVID